MTRFKHSHWLAAIAATALLMAAPVNAKRPAATAKPDDPPAEQVTPGGEARYGVKLGAFFREEHRKAARRFFTEHYARGKECPPGMERGERGSKGCAPPVPGRYWAVGRPLQSSVKEYPVPPPLASRLPVPPEGYRYAMVGDDIVLLASGSKLVVDIIEDVLI